ncbi:ureidoglycolate lyase [Roseovarius aestuarii]|nr:ureidoglycolate lyase [Roseovarius aestuarii]
MIPLLVQPLTHAAFAPYGQVIDVAGAPSQIINQGMCARHSDLASLDVRGGCLGISLFDAQPRALPYVIDMVERHPNGTQAFLPIQVHSYLVVVADDLDGTPHGLRAFLASAAQGINLKRGVWHGVLSPLKQQSLFAVIDRIPADANLEEFRLPEKYVITGYCQVVCSV